MQGFTLNQRLFAEFLGTLFLVCTVVGSGIMGDQLSGGNVGIALLGNTIPTGAILVVLIMILGPISGAHFNPVVSLVFCLRGELSRHQCLLYSLVQIIGGCLGTLLAHLMFDWNLLELGDKSRTGVPQWLAEVVASFGLLLTILCGVRFRSDAIPYLVGLYITAAYWFTASTSFANPAVTIGRSFTTSFAGIDPSHAFGFIVAQIIGAVLAHVCCSWLLKGERNNAV